MNRVGLLDALLEISELHSGGIFVLIMFPEYQKYSNGKCFLVIGPHVLSVCLRIGKNSGFSVLHMSPINAEYPCIGVSMWPNMNRSCRRCFYLLIDISLVSNILCLEL
jgi:hypothetical protein